MTSLIALKKPDIKISVKQTFGIETEMEVDGFSKKGSHLAMDDVYDSIGELAYYREVFIRT